MPSSSAVCCEVDKTLKRRHLFLIPFRFPLPRLISSMPIMCERCERRAHCLYFLIMEQQSDAIGACAPLKTTPLTMIALAYATHIFMAHLSFASVAVWMSCVPRRHRRVDGERGRQEEKENWVIESFNSYSAYGRTFISATLHDDDVEMSEKHNRINRRTSSLRTRRDAYAVCCDCDCAESDR